MLVLKYLVLSNTIAVHVCSLNAWESAHTKPKEENVVHLRPLPASPE